MRFSFVLKDCCILVFSRYIVQTWSEAVGCERVGCLRATHWVSDPAVHGFSTSGYLVPLGGYFLRRNPRSSSVSAPCTAEWKHLSIPGANARGKTA